jgi:DNA-binding NarL/FixJ family response regulator
MSEREPIRVLICDDQDVVRRGLQVILRHSDGMEVVDVAADGQEGVEKALQHRPDLVLMDLKMPRLNGIHATRRITRALPETRVLVLTTYDGDEWVFDAVRAGAHGYLLKDTDGDVLVEAIRDTAAGRVRLDPQIAGKILTAFKDFDNQPPAPDPHDPVLEQLTDRELTILQQMAQGRTNSEIAEALFLAEGTVKNHVSRILSKLHSNDRTQAVIAALRRGIVSLDEEPDR